MPKRLRSICGASKKRKLTEESSPSSPEEDLWSSKADTESVSTIRQNGRAGEDAWLTKSVARFGLHGSAQPAASESQWKHYFRSRILLEFMEAATLAPTGSNTDDIWPDDLGPQPDATALCIEPSSKQNQLRIVSPMRSSVVSLVASSSLKVDAVSLSRGLFLLSCSVFEPSDSEPDSVMISTRLYAPSNSGNYVDLTYESHKYVCSGSIERYSHLYALRDGFHDDSAQVNANATDKIFEIDLNESGHGKLGTRALVTIATLGKISKHLFGKTRALSPRKMFSLLVRCAGVGLCGEDNKPISQARRHFKNGDNDIDTDDD